MHAVHIRGTDTMRERYRKECSVLVVAVIVLTFVFLTFASTKSDVATATSIPMSHASFKAVQANDITILVDSTTTGTFSTTTTAVTTTTSTKTTTTTTTSTTLTTTRSTSTTTTTICYVTTTTRTTSTTYVSTSFYSTVTTPITIGVASTDKTTTTTTTTSTKTEMSQLLFTTLITTTMTMTATPRSCIIASVAYGSPFAPEVQLLREFRDEIVMQSFAGGQFMMIFDRFYYSFSTEVAGVVAETPFLQALIRVIIYPLIASLRVSTSILIFLPEMAGLTIVVLGMIESALLGVIYASPLIILPKIANSIVHELKRRSEVKTCPKQRTG
jgi:hypothetical protein